MEPIKRGLLNEIAPGVWYLPVVMANAYLVGRRGGPWVLVDAGVRGTSWRFTQAAQECFGGRPPEAIVLTHAHFDHVGALDALLREWRVPVYAHRLEMPYLTGRASYPPPDPTVGGFMPQLSRVFPRGPIDISGHVHEFSEDGTLPGMPGWRWIFTPGHSPGHVSLFRDEDRALLAGDAFITVNQENPVLLMSQKRVFHRPPLYYTHDWQAARESVQRLAELRPNIAATGHGLPVSGEDTARGLERLAAEFAPPAHGRYVHTPVQFDESGPVYIPPAPPDQSLHYAAGIAIAGVATAAMLIASRRRASQYR